MSEPVFPPQVRELLDRLEALCQDARRLREQINEALKRERAVNRPASESDPYRTPGAK